MTFTARPKSRKRTYRFDIFLPPLQAAAWDVVQSIERHTVRVCDPANDRAMDDVWSPEGAFLVDSDATLEVPLEDWLAVGCQRMRWEEARDEPAMSDETLGLYSHNATAAFGGPYQESKPHGPSVFVGEVILPRRMQNAYLEHSQNRRDSAAITRAFQLVVAHELVHVFDVLKYIVPAFMDWPRFWRDVLGEGTRSDLFFGRLCIKSRFIDDYGGPNELASLRDWWPSRATDWWRARPWLNRFVGS